MTQRPLFDLDASRSARDSGVALAARGTDDDWADRALEAVHETALKLSYFASDDVWQRGLEKPREPRAMGPVMMRAVRLGYCEATAMTRATSNVTQHAQPIRVYRSLLKE